MTADVVLVVLASAFLHAGWNAVAHAEPDRLASFCLMGFVQAGAGAALVLLGPAPAPASRPLIATSAVLHVAYTLMLVASYRLGDFGQAYPLARGTSPWLVGVASVTLVGEHLSSTAVVGLVVISAGLVALAFTTGALTRASLGAVGAALATGVLIAAYTTVDGVGVRRAAGVTGYAGWIFLLQGAAFPLVAVALSRAGLRARLRAQRTSGLLGGVMSLLAYGLVLWAQERGALAPIAALRETSVVIAAVIGAVAFHEPYGRARILATVLVAAGVVLVST